MPQGFCCPCSFKQTCSGHLREHSRLLYLGRSARVSGVRPAVNVFRVTNQLLPKQRFPFNEQPIFVFHCSGDCNASAVAFAVYKWAVVKKAAGRDPKLIQPVLSQELSDHHAARFYCTRVTTFYGMAQPRLSTTVCRLQSVRMKASPLWHDLLMLSNEGPRDAPRLLPWHPCDAPKLSHLGCCKDIWKWCIDIA